MSTKIGAFEFFMGPQQLGADDDLRQVILDFINGAQKRLYIAIQEIDSIEIAEAIIGARKRGVNVKMVVENDYLRSNKPHQQPFSESGKYEINRTIQNALLRTAIRVHSDFNSKIFHQKFMVRDSASVLTGSTNFTGSGTSSNLNHIAIIHDEKIARIYNREYTEIQQGHFGKLNEGHDPKPPQIEVSGLPLKVTFAPDHNPEMEIMKQMAKAKKSIHFAIFTFSESSGIDDQLKLVSNSNNNIEITGVFDRMMVNQKWAANHHLVDTSAKLFKTKKVTGLNKLHHKLMVIDEQVVIMGSFNYTGPANKLNDENIIIIGKLDTEDVASTQVQKQLGQACVTEINRIISEFGEEL